MYNATGLTLAKPTKEGEPLRAIGYHKEVGSKSAASFLYGQLKNKNYNLDLEVNTEAIQASVASFDNREIRDENFNIIGREPGNMRVLLNTRNYNNALSFSGSPDVRKSFNLGFVLIHELFHRTYYRDVASDGSLPVVDRVNEFRKEAGLPIRTAYGEMIRRNVVSIPFQSSNGENAGRVLLNRNVIIRRNEIEN